ncbi:surface lipoprotein assembly modifier [Pseudooceanicola sp. 502str34]
MLGLPAVSVARAQDGAPIPDRAETATPSGTAATTYGAARALMQAGRTEEAEALLMAWRPASRAEEHQRLWALAVLMRDTGRPEEALRYLEPLVAARPDVGAFRLALGEVLQSLGQDERAAFHLRQAGGGTLTADQRDRVQRSLSGLDQGRVWSGHLAFSLEPESNPFKATSDRTVVIDGREFTLRDSARARAATGLGIEAGLAYAPLVAPATRARLALSFDATLYDGYAPNDVQARAEVGLLHGALESGRSKASLSYTRRWIDGRGFSMAPGVTLGYARMLSQRGRIEAAATVEWHDHDRFTALDGPRMLLFLGYSHAVTPQLLLRVGLRGERTAAEVASYSLTAGELTLGASYAFRGGVMASFDLGLRRADYDAPAPLFGATRKEERVTATLRLLHRRLTLRGFAPVLELEAERQTSSVGFYGYENFAASLGLTREF